MTKLVLALALTLLAADGLAAQQPAAQPRPPEEVLRAKRDGRPVETVTAARAAPSAPSVVIVPPAGRSALPLPPRVESLAAPPMPDLRSFKRPKE